jgi:hypothetical protein
LSECDYAEVRFGVGAMRFARKRYHFRCGVIDGRRVREGFVAEIPGPTRVYSLSLDEEDYNEQFGSAEREQDEELSNSVVERGRAMSHTTPGAPRGTLTNTHENHVPVDPAPSCSSGLLPMLASLLLLLLRI